MNAPRHVINISDDVFKKLIRHAKYGDSIDSILRTMMKMKNGRRQGRPIKRLAR